MVLTYIILGWQYQSSTPTLQCTLEQALTQVTKLHRQDLCLVGASRTDTGVHALGQVCLPSSHTHMYIFSFSTNDYDY